MTAKDTLKSKVLKNKDWTGWNVARAFLLDLVANYENLTQKGQNTHLLTDTEKQTLVDNLRRPEDIKTYNQLKLVHDYLVNSPLMYTHTDMDMSLQLARIGFIVFEIYMAETDQYYRIMKSPLIVTQERYAEMVKADREEKLAETYSVEMLFMDTLAYYAGHLTYGQNVKKVPAAIAKALKAMGTKQVNIKRLNDIWASWEKEEPLTEGDVLKYISDFYESMETDSNKTFMELSKDFPALYNAVMDYILSFKELAYIKDIPKSKYVTKLDAVAVSLLYKMGYSWAKDYVDTFDPVIKEPKDGERYSAGVAIIQNTGWATPEPDANGIIPRPYNPIWSAWNTEEFLLNPQMKKSIKWRIDRIKDDMINLYGQHILMNKIKTLLDLDQLEVLLQPIEVSEDRIAKLNENMKTAVESITPVIPNRDTERVRAEVQELLAPIDLAPLKEQAEQCMGPLNVTLESFRYDIYNWASTLYNYTVDKPRRGRN